MDPRPPSRRRSVRRPPALALAALVLLAQGCDPASEDVASAAEPSAVTVEVVEVQPELLRNVVEIPGQLEAELSVVLRAETEGILESIEFAEGETVAEGELLFRLRDAEQRARLQEARAQLELANAVWERTRTLAARNISSQAQLDEAAGQRAVAQARVALARVELERTRIRAPFSGALGARLVAPGDRIEEATQLVRIDALERLQLLFSLPEVAVGLIRPGTPVRVQVAPFPGEWFDGRVFFVSPTLEPASRRIRIKAWMPNADGRLRPGLFAEVEAEIERSADALLVPESALVNAMDGTYVWRIGAEGRAEKVPVEVGIRREGRVQIASGLRSGDVVVSAGVHKVMAGSRVRVAGAEGEGARRMEAARRTRPEGDS